MNSNLNQVCIVYVTTASLGNARDLARSMVEENHVACANIFPIQSIYRWQGRIEESQEFQIFFKTSTSKFADLQRRIIELHPYENPEIIQIPIVDGNEAYLSWIHECVKIG